MVGWRGTPMSEDGTIHLKEASNVHVDDINKVAAQDPLWIAIAHAIQSYAQLEQSLCHIMAYTGDIKGDVAATIFFKIAAASARNSILEKLIRKKFGDRFNLFWNAFFKDLRVTDQRRNEIVHWNVVNSISFKDEHTAVVTPTLNPPNFWDRDKNTPSLGIPELVAFIAKCSTYSRLCTMFFASTSGKMPLDAAKEWLDIFQQPLVYPLPEDHPLNRKPPKPDIQSQSSGP